MGTQKHRMILLILSLFAKVHKHSVANKTDSTSGNVTDVNNPDNKVPPPPEDLFNSKKWCPEKSKLCVFAAASKILGFVDMQLEFTLQPKNYVAIGFGGNKMTNSDMLVISNIKKKGNKTEIIAEDYYSTGYVAPTKDKQQDFQVLTKDERSGGRYTIIVRRNIDTGDKEDNPFSWNESFEMIWARGKVGKNGLEQHAHSPTDRGSLEMMMEKFIDPTNSGTATSTSSSSSVTATSNPSDKGNSSFQLTISYSLVLLSLL